MVCTGHFFTNFVSLDQFFFARPKFPWQVYDKGGWIDSNIKFTIQDLDESNPIPFLDTEVSIDSDNIICTEFYIRQAHSFTTDQPMPRWFTDNVIFQKEKPWVNSYRGWFIMPTIRTWTCYIPSPIMQFSGVPLHYLICSGCVSYSCVPDRRAACKVIQFCW